jgi:hypothetical protein
VKPERDQNNRAAYAGQLVDFWQSRAAGLCGPQLAGLPRYIATVETSKHRTFQFSRRRACCPTTS